MPDALRMADHPRFGEFPQQGTRSAGMVDMDVGQRHVVDAFDTVPAQLAKQIGDGR
jgi:hypothetical protein